MLRSSSRRALVLAALLPFLAFGSARRPIALETVSRRSEAARIHRENAPGVPDAARTGTSTVSSDRPESWPNRHRAFPRPSASSVDSLLFSRSEEAFHRQQFDSALGHNLAAYVPASGAFREALLAQRARIFSRLWPAADPHGTQGPGTARRTLTLDAGTSHARGVSRWGSFSPYARGGYLEKTRVWSYQGSARLDWPLTLSKQPLDLAASVSTGLSDAAGQASCQAALEAAASEGLLRGISITLASGFETSREYGMSRTRDLRASREWSFASVDATFRLGLSRQWDADWNRRQDHGWADLGKGFTLPDGSRLQWGLAAVFDRLDPMSGRITAPLLYVDDVSRVRPTHYRGPDFREWLPKFSPESYRLYAEHTGEMRLSLQAPQSSFSLSPSLRYGFSLPAGWEAEVGAWYAIDLYPRYAWDRVPLPDSLVPGAEDLVGVALNRADGRHYAVVLSAMDGGFTERYGTEPLERHRARRWDHSLGADVGLSKSLPGGHTLSVSATSAAAWSNLPASAPASSQPWQWGLDIDVSRSFGW